VEFKEFGAVWTQLRDFSRESLAQCSFEEDPIFLETPRPILDRANTLPVSGITSPAIMNITRTHTTNLANSLNKTEQYIQAQAPIMEQRLGQQLLTTNMTTINIIQIDIDQWFPTGTSGSITTAAQLSALTLQPSALSPENGINPPLTGPAMAPFQLVA
jgi:hypothetical protein